MTHPHQTSVHATPPTAAAPDPPRTPAQDGEQFRVVTVFPRPPAHVRRALTAVETPPVPPDSGDADADALEFAKRVSQHAKLPRPWLPAQCPPQLRRVLFDWLSDVASWINHEYMWQPDKVIPPCWIMHPHIAHELPLIAFARIAAERDTTVKALEDWQRHTLPLFLTRMTDRLAGSCVNNKHTSWPAQQQFTYYNDHDVVRKRRQVIALDTRADAGNDTDAQDAAVVEVRFDTGEVLD